MSAKEKLVLHNKVLLDVNTDGVGYLTINKPDNLPATSALSGRYENIWWVNDYDGVKDVYMHHPNSYDTVFEGSGLSSVWNKIINDYDNFGMHVVAEYPESAELSDIVIQNGLTNELFTKNRYVTSVCTKNYIHSPRAIAYIENNRVINDCPSGNLELYQVWWYKTNDDMKHQIRMSYVWIGDDNVVELAKNYDALSPNDKLSLLRTLRLNSKDDGSSIVDDVMKTIKIHLVPVIVYMSDFYNMRFLQNGQHKPYLNDKAYDLGIGDSTEVIKQKWNEFWVPNK